MGGSKTLAYPIPTSGTQQPTTQPGTADYENKRALSLRNLPDFKLEDNAIIVAELNEENTKIYSCPSCQSTLDEYDIFDGSCCVCHIPIAEKNINVATLLENLGYYCTRNRIDKNVPAYLWCKDSKNVDFIIRLTPTTLINSIFGNSHLDDPYVILEDSLVNDGHGLLDDNIFTLCCGRTLQDAQLLCYCSTQILTSDFIDFEEETKKFKSMICLLHVLAVNSSTMQTVQNI